MTEQESRNLRGDRRGLSVLAFLIHKWKHGDSEKVCGPVTVTPQIRTGSQLLWLPAMGGNIDCEVPCDTGPRLHPLSVVWPWFGRANEVLAQSRFSRARYFLGIVPYIIFRNTLQVLHVLVLHAEDILLPVKLKKIYHQVPINALFTLGSI